MLSHQQTDDVHWQKPSDARREHHSLEPKALPGYSLHDAIIAVAHKEQSCELGQHHSSPATLRSSAAGLCRMCKPAQPNDCVKQTQNVVPFCASKVVITATRRLDLLCCPMHVMYWQPFDGADLPMESHSNAQMPGQSQPHQEDQAQAVHSVRGRAMLASRPLPMT